MQRFIWASSYVAGGLVAGCFSALLLVQQSGTEPLSGSGAWSARQAVAGGSARAFYARAHDLLAARLPPPPGQIVEATATTDDAGSPLSSACTYRLTARDPLPAWWSLGASASGAADAVLQASASSDSVIRDADGSLHIAAASGPVPGNWLRLPDGRGLSLVYWGLSPGRAAPPPPFTITREGCS